MIVESTCVELESEVDAGAAAARLVARARDGDALAFDALYRRFARSVHAVLLARVSAQEAEELTQEVFLAAHRRLANLREAGAIGPWLHTMARNLAIDRLRARGRRPIEEPLGEHARPATQDDELRERVMTHVRGLPAAYQETLVMRLVDGLTGPEIAEATGLTAASVRVNLCRGMELLRARLKKEGWP
jgi:RNA polymerase sigma-70 factor (ECF subfamily)